MNVLKNLFTVTLLTVSGSSMSASVDGVLSDLDTNPASQSRGKTKIVAPPSAAGPYAFDDGASQVSKALTEAKTEFDTIAEQMQARLRYILRVLGLRDEKNKASVNKEEVITAATAIKELMRNRDAYEEELISKDETIAELSARLDQRAEELMREREARERLAAVQQALDEERVAKEEALKRAEENERLHAELEAMAAEKEREAAARRAAEARLAQMTADAARFDEERRRHRVDLVKGSKGCLGGVPASVAAQETPERLRTASRLARFQGQEGAGVATDTFLEEDERRGRRPTPPGKGNPKTPLLTEGEE